MRGKLKNNGFHIKPQSQKLIHKECVTLFPDQYYTITFITFLKILQEWRGAWMLAFKHEDLDMEERR